MYVFGCLRCMLMSCVQAFVTALSALTAVEAEQCLHFLPATVAATEADATATNLLGLRPLMRFSASGPTAPLLTPPEVRGAIQSSLPSPSPLQVPHLASNTPASYPQCMSKYVGTVDGCQQLTRLPLRSSSPQLQAVHTVIAPVLEARLQADCGVLLSLYEPAPTHKATAAAASR